MLLYRTKALKRFFLSSANQRVYFVEYLPNPLLVAMNIVKRNFTPSKSFCGFASALKLKCRCKLNFS